MNPSPTCRHLHTDGRPCGSPALRGEPFCFHHHTSRKPMPKRVDPTDPRILLSPQLPAPDDFPAIQRAVGEVLRLLANDRLPESRAAILLKGLAIASQNLARQHRREEKLAALGLLPAPVTAFTNHPQHGTIAVDPEAPTSETEAARSTEDEAGSPTDPLPDPIPVLTPDPSPQTSYDEAKTIEINNYFQAIDDKRRARSAEHLAQRKAELEAQLEQELHQHYEDRYTEREAELTAQLEARFEAQLEAQLQAQLQTQREAHLAQTPIQQNHDLTNNYENCLALVS